MHWLVNMHQLQPLDVSDILQAFEEKCAYNRSAVSWMVANPGKRLSVYEIAAAFGRAYMQTATPDKPIHGFEVTGIWPHNTMVFKPEDFAAAYVTEEDWRTLILILQNRTVVGVFFAVQFQ